MFVSLDAPSAAEMTTALDALRGELESRGATVNEAAWGYRVLVIEDPDGNTLYFNYPNDQLGAGHPNVAADEHRGDYARAPGTAYTLIGPPPRFQPSRNSHVCGYAVSIGSYVSRVFHANGDSPRSSQPPNAHPDENGSISQPVAKSRRSSRCLRQLLST